MTAGWRRSHGGWWLGISFALIAFFFGALEAAGVFWSRHIGNEVGDLVDNTQVSLELVATIDHDVGERRWLIAQHVFEERGKRMDELEDRIARLSREIDALIVTYRPLATYRGELQAWRELKWQSGHVAEPMARALALSRANRDAEALGEMRVVEREDDHIHNALRTLTAVNQDAASESSRRIHRLQRLASLVQAVLVLVGISFTALVATFAVRLVHRRERQLASYSQRLEERNSELDAFAGRVAHDLRRPLQAIAIAGEVLARQPNARSTGAAHRRSVDRMESIIRDLLALSRAGMTNEECCAPVSVAAELREELAERVARDGATLRVEVAPGNVRCSPTLLRQALANLIDNGLKYRAPDRPPELEVLGHLDGPWYELQVCDHGVGLSPEETELLFQPFYRAGRVHGAPGTGLGRTIVKRVVEACGGTVSVRSALGRGTTFVLRLPQAVGVG